MEFRPLSYLKKLTSSALGGPVWRGGPGDIVATIYDDGVILEVSSSAENIIGAAGNLVGRSLFDFVSRDDRAGVRAAMDFARESGIYSDAKLLTAPFRLLRVRRAAASAEVTFKPIGRGRLQALIRDRGEAFARARETRISACENDRAARDSVRNQGSNQVPEQSPIQSDMMADLSHEMKTPLNAIMGFADAMRAETFGPLGHEKYRDYADDIHASGAHLMDLIATVLDYAKTQSGQYILNPVLGDPGSVITECAAMIRGEAEKAGLTLSVSIAPDLPETMIDARAVRQILINLLSNAVKFTKTGEIALSVSEKCGALDFIVRDTGVGMNEVVLSKLGGRYSDTHKNGVRGTEGTGLGLSLAFTLAKLHGGALKIASTPGEGTTARFTLPVRRSHDDLPEDETSNIYPVRSIADVQSQLDRVNAFRRERANAA